MCKYNRNINIIHYHQLSYDINMFHYQNIFLYFFINKIIHINIQQKIQSHIKFKRQMIGGGRNTQIKQNRAIIQDFNQFMIKHKLKKNKKNNPYQQYSMSANQEEYRYVEYILNNIKNVGKPDINHRDYKFYKIQKDLILAKEAQEGNRIYEKKIIIDAMLKKGYGCQQFQQYLQENNMAYRDRDKYKALALSAMTETLRRLQNMIRIQCRKKIKNIKNEDLRSITFVLFNFKDYMTNDNANCFTKFLKLVYGLANVRISQYEAINLYQEIMQFLRLKLTDRDIIKISQQGKQPGQRQYREMQQQINQEERKLWNSRYDRILVELYKLNTNFYKILNYLATIYPQTNGVFNCLSLSYRLQSILINITKQLKTLIYKTEVVAGIQLPKLHNIDIKKIVQDPEYDNIAMMLLEIDLDSMALSEEAMGINELERIIKEINKRVQQKLDNSKVNRMQQNGRENEEQNIFLKINRQITRNKNNKLLKEFDKCDKYDDNTHDNKTNKKHDANKYDWLFGSNEQQQPAQNKQLQRYKKFKQLYKTSPQYVSYQSKQQKIRQFASLRQQQQYSQSQPQQISHTIKINSASKKEQYEELQQSYSDS